jgi:MFS family permease
MSDMAKMARPGTRRFGTGYQVMLLVLIMLVSAFAYVDRTVLQTLGQSIKEDLSLSDFQLGLLGGLSFAVFYSTLGLPLARLAETKSRVTIISASVALFSLFSGLCGLATGFATLFLFRVGVGVGEAGVSAPGTSLIGDHFPPHRRGMALTLMRLGGIGVRHVRRRLGRHALWLARGDRHRVRTGAGRRVALPSAAARAAARNE